MYLTQNTNLMKIYSCAERDLEHFETSYKPSFGPLILRVGILYPPSCPNSEERPKNECPFNVTY
jgi:hypothetical protein